MGEFKFQRVMREVLAEKTTGIVMRCGNWPCGLGKSILSRGNYTLDIYSLC